MDWRYDTQHNDIQHNDSCYNHIWHKDTLNNYTWNNDPQDSDTQYKEAAVEAIFRPPFIAIRNVAS